MGATLLVLVGVSWVVVLPLRLYLMMSWNITEEIRSRIFITQLGATASVLLLIALFIWTIKGGGSTVNVLGEYFVFTPTVGYLVASYLLLLLVIPYLIGHFRSKAWIERLDDEWQKLVENLVAGLASPNIAKATEALNEVAQDTRAALEQLTQDNFFELVSKTKNSADDQQSVIRLALADSVTKDAHYIHAVRLRKLMELIADCSVQLEAAAASKDKRDVLDDYVKSLEREKAPRVGEAARSNPLVLTVLTALAGAILNLFVSWALKIISSQLGMGE